ncbi:MAG: hypothetical protein ACPG61_11035 [Paracoccaceae bacterium]
MKRPLYLMSFCAALVALPAISASACPWAGGDYSFKEHGIYGTFTVNGSCSEIVWSRLSDGPETQPLEKSKHSWSANMNKAKVELLENGSSLRVSDYGGISRQFTAKPAN